MPVSHIGLTVSHLPTSTSFFAAALQPLGYRYIGQSGNQVGFGISDADFFLCQESPGVKAGAAHIAFTAPSSTAVRNFYTAALTAGARPNGAPATRCAEDGHFNAAVLDFDGNSIEVVCRNAPDLRDDGTVISHSRVMTWQRTVTGSYRDDRSVISSRTSASKAVAPEVPAKAESVVSAAPSVARSVSAPAVPQAAAPASTDSGNSAAKQIIGTLLGAAAGAAVAYAMVRSEQDSAKKENDFSAYMVAKETVRAAVGHLAQASSQPQLAMSDPQPALEPAHPAPQSVHRNIDAQSYHSSTPPQPRSVCAPRQIEAAPPSYYAPAYTSAPPTQVNEPRTLEYVPAYSVAPSAASQARSRMSAHRSVTSPELLTIERARSSVSTVKPETVVSVLKPKSVAAHSVAQSVAHSTAPSSLISSFVPDHVERRSSAGSVHSHHSSRSKAKSSHSHSSRHSSSSKHSSRHSRVEESSPSPTESKAESKAPSKAPSKAASIISSILGRDDKKSSASKNDDDDFIDDLDIEEVTEDDDMSTVVPSDSVSQAGGRRHRSHRSHRSKKDDDDSSVISKQSSSSKHSKHSHRSHRSHKSHSNDSENAADDEGGSKPRRHSRPSVVSEPSDASTIKPVKPAKPSSRVSVRKDSVTQGQYDGLFDEVQYGAGSVAVRGITPSMISAAGKNKNRSMMSFNHAQKMRTFEGQA